MAEERAVESITFAMLVLMTEVSFDVEISYAASNPITIKDLEINFPGDTIVINVTTLVAIDIFTLLDL